MSDDPTPSVTGPAPEGGAGHLPGADEDELLAAFDRLAPQGGVRWAFDDAARRVDLPDHDSAAGAHPWTGLPDDLWERGRSARIGQRFVGEVATVMADLLAADARASADAAVEAVNGDRFVATWDALQYLSARVEALEARVDPLRLEPAEWAVEAPDASEWHGLVGEWLSTGPVAGDEGPVLVGESGDGSLVAALRSRGLTVVGVEPRGAEVWESFAGQVPGIVFDHVGRHLRTLGDKSAAGVVLLGCIDRADLAGKADLLAEAIRVVRPGGALVVLPADQGRWDAALGVTGRDLAPGRPFHPETWSLLLGRSGAVDVAWHRPATGALHAVVARVAQ
jgi:SAM-dependent methyltransferase